MIERYLEQCREAGSRKQLALITRDYIRGKIKRTVKCYCVTAMPRAAVLLEDGAEREDTELRLPAKHLQAGGIIKVDDFFHAFDIPGKQSHKQFLFTGPSSALGELEPVLKVWQHLAAMLDKVHQSTVNGSDNFYGHLISQMMHDVQSLVDINKRDVDEDERTMRLDYQSKVNKDLLFLLRDFELFKSDIAIDVFIRDSLSLLELDMPAIPDTHSSFIVNVDVELFSRAFNEIVKNAIEMTESMDRVYIECRLKDGVGVVPETKWCELSVSDDGGGVPVDFLPYIKKPFFTTKKYSGHPGLGLTIAEKIINEHGGTLTISSSPPRTTVIILIPVKNNDL